jgi:aminoglycoside/choline kinase family phosphotransferase
MEATDAVRDRLYALACSFVPKLQALEASADEIPAFGRIYDNALVMSKLWKFEHWAIPGLLDREANAEERAAFAELYACLASAFENAPRRLAHRDFKAENLHWISDTSVPSRGDPREQIDRLVMIDVQGAFMAPPEYDLVCLLYDLQVDLDEERIQALLAQTRPLLPDAPSAEDFAQRFDLLAIARLCKDVSHIVEAGLVRGDRRRWAEIPRGLTLLARAAGRQEHTFPCLRALTSVIPALTEAARSSDSA